MKFCTLSPHAYHPHQPDKIYAANKAATAAIQKYGSEAVINATLGTCLDDHGNNMILPTVDNLIRHLPEEDLYNYAPIAGLPGFEEAVATSLFGQWRPDSRICAIPTPGATGAIRHLVWNFLDAGEPLLSSDWCWNPYRGICEEHGRLFETFHLLQNNASFNMADFDRAVGEQLNRHHCLAILLNTPAHNPTGYRITVSEMTDIAAIIKKHALSTGKPITTCLDLSYVDYDLQENESEHLVECFRDMPENTMLTAVFSMSKSFTMPGIRCGALIAFAKTEEAAAEFKNTMAYSSRSVWSNTVRGAQKVLVQICSDTELHLQVCKERKQFAQTITHRGKIFAAEAASHGLQCCPYTSGFFVAIPCAESEALVQKLQRENVFAVALKQGIRISCCSLPTEKCVRLAKVIAAAAQTPR